MRLTPTVRLEKGLCADSGEKHAPASDPDTVTVDSLKALDPSRPIREATKLLHCTNRRYGPINDCHGIPWHWHIIRPIAALGTTIFGSEAGNVHVIAKSTIRIENTYCSVALRAKSIKTGEGYS